MNKEKKIAIEVEPPAVFWARRREEAIQAIVEEREFQDKKHGAIHAGVGHTLGEWIILMEDELAEAKRALIKGGKGRDSVRAEIVQVTALGLACLEEHTTVDPHEGRQI